MWKKISRTPSESIDSRTLLPGDGFNHSIHAKDDLEPKWTKYLIVPGLLCTTLINLALIAGQKGHWTITGGSARTINDNPSTFSAIRQVIASLLGAIYMFTVCMLINWTSRVILGRRPVSLDRLDFWSALVGSRISWTLKKSRIPLILLFVILTRIPAALWAGALAPSTSTASQPHANLTTLLPRYTDASLAQYSPHGLFEDNDPLISTSLGIFSFSPVRDRFGFLINDGASASTQNATLTPLYKKNDNSNYTYYGRSYGVGSSVGLVDRKIGTRHESLNSFTYNETGTLIGVSCIVNRSTDFHLELAYSSDKVVYPNIYEATGCPPWIGPGNDCGGFSEIGMGGDDAVVAVAWWNQYSNIENYIGTLAIASGANYTALNNTQCNVSMIPKDFTIAVSVKEGLITVTPQDGGVDPPNGTNPMPIVSSAFTTFASLSEVASTKFTSAIGNLLNSNINNVLLQKTNETDEQKTLRGISEAIQVVMDDALVAYGSAQLMLANVTRPVQIHLVVDALTIGTPTYVYIVAGLNAAVVIAVVFEAVRTKGWKGMPRWNYMSVKSTVVSSSMGGMEIGRTVENLHRAANTAWRGDANDRINGNLKVRLRRINGLALTLENGSRSFNETSRESGVDLPDWSSNVELGSDI